MELTDFFEADLPDQLALETLRDLDVPSCPKIILELLHEAQREDVDFIRVSRLITGDVAMAATVLKSANSPFFALRRKVESVQQAVSVLGLRNLLKIIYGAALKQSLDGASRPGLDRFWERSNLNAVVAAHLAGRLAGASADNAYTFGLFHNAGVAVMLRKFEGYEQTLEEVAADPLRTTAIEDARHHANHVVVGAMLARNWHLSEPLVWAIRYHHDLSVLDKPRKHATPEVCQLVAIRLIADRIVSRFLGQDDDAEWQQGKAAALGHLGWAEEDIGGFAGSLEAELREIQAYRAA